MSEAIICYDIACPRRLGRVHRHLKKCALPLQYSVFLFTGTDNQLQHCLSQLEKLIDPRQDDVRAYPLPQRGLRLCMGRATLPEGIFLSDLPAPWNGTAPTETTTPQPIHTPKRSDRDDPNDTPACIII